MISLMRRARKRQAVISRCRAENIPLIKSILTDIVGNLFFCLCLARSGYKINCLLMEWMVGGRKLPSHLPASGLKLRIYFSARHGGTHTFNYSIWETGGSLSWRPRWSTKWVRGQPEKSTQRNLVLKANFKGEQNKRIKETDTFQWAESGRAARATQGNFEK